MSPLLTGQLSGPPRGARALGYGLARASSDSEDRGLRAQPGSRVTQHRKPGSASVQNRGHTHIPCWTLPGGLALDFIFVTHQLCHLNQFPWQTLWAPVFSSVKCRPNAHTCRSGSLRLVRSGKARGADVVSPRGDTLCPSPSLSGNTVESGV